MPRSRWARSAPVITKPAICHPPPKPPLAPLPPLPPYLLVAASLHYDAGGPPLFDVGGFCRCPAAGSPTNFAGKITHSGQTLSIQISLATAPPTLAIMLQGSVNCPPGDTAQSGGHPWLPGQAWTITIDHWSPGEPYQLAAATITN